MKVQQNELMPDFRYDTAFSRGNNLSELVNKVSGKTALIFLRYYGCPMCQLDLFEYAVNYEKVTQTGGQIAVVLQSHPNVLRQEITDNTFPYEIICDPDMELYQKFSIDPAPSMLKMMSLKAVKKVIRSSKLGYKHGLYEGNEQQLPATFILDADLRVHHAHYGKDAGDVPNVLELAQLMK